MLVRPNGKQRGTQRHALPDDLIGLLGRVCQRGVQGRLVAAGRQAAALQRGRGARVPCRVHGQQQLAVALDKVRAQRLVPARQEGERALQRARVQLAAQAHGLHHVVCRAVGLHLVQRQHLLLVG